MNDAITSDDIRRRFLDFFERHGHAVRPSGSLVPDDGSGMLFADAGMVPFRLVFLGLEEPAFGRRATTAQKCVRVAGKHNDLEQVGRTPRHQTFFEMLGNFSFGDYFKRDAIRLAWEFLTEELRIPKAHFRVTVFRTDDEARALWREIAGLDDSLIYGLGEADNFWQMAETGPCGPASAIFIDLARVVPDWAPPTGADGEWTEVERTEFSEAAFVAGVEGGRFLETWNLVFMQFDRQLDDELRPLPIQSVDTGAGLERLAAIVQGVNSNYLTDLFKPLIATVETLVGMRYDQALAGAAPTSATGQRVDALSFRVLADHARAITFLLSDGVFPASDGRGYVLRRILRRAVRHAWLLGRREPTVVHVVQTVIDTMSGAYPGLKLHAGLILDAVRAEEDRFLETIDAGMTRFDQLAPARATTIGSVEVRGTISGDDAFRLYDSYGFAIDLLVLMARERGYTVDIGGFERALEVQRSQSRDHRARQVSVSLDTLADLSQWQFVDEAHRTSLPDHIRFVGYDQLEADTHVAAIRSLGQGAFALVLNERPFYAEAGGQVADQGEVVADTWRLDVTDVRQVGEHVAVVGRLEGEFHWGPVVARVSQQVRQDTERNHTATHLLYGALKRVLGAHVHQRGSLVAPDRLRFDFSHTSPLTRNELLQIEAMVNREIARAVPLSSNERPYARAIADGAVAVFSEKYGEVVRVVTVPGFSVELCDGTHVRNTSEVLQFKIVSETGLGGGIRRIEAVTARAAYARTLVYEEGIARIADAVRMPPDPETVASRVEQVLAKGQPQERPPV